MSTHKPLSLLDTYARCLTFQQATRLYESKTSKKADKKLFESTYTSKKTYTFNIDAYTVYDTIGMSMDTMHAEICNIMDEHIKDKDATLYCDDERIEFRTPNLLMYERFVSIMDSMFPEIHEDGRMELCLDPDYME